MILHEYFSGPLLYPSIGETYRRFPREAAAEGTGWSKANFRMTVKLRRRHMVREAGIVISRVDVRNSADLLRESI